MQKVSLDGVWQLSTANGKYQNIPAQLPGDNYSALINAGLCPDPYWADNEQIIQHFRLESWIFEREFTLPAKFAASACPPLLEKRRRSDVTAISRVKKIKSAKTI